MVVSKPKDDATVWMSGTYTTQGLQLKRAQVREALSRPTETTIELVAKEKNRLEPKDMVGKIITLHSLSNTRNKPRTFTGTCISVEALGVRDGYDHYVAEVRPWFWLLTLTRDSRIFQNKTVKEIIKDVLEDHGFSHYAIKTSGSFEKREYCVQYRESDFDFLSRLMEEEGIYYFFREKGPDKDEEIVFANSKGPHRETPDGELIFKPRDPDATKRVQNVTEWAAEKAVVTSVVSLTDYDFMNPGVRQEAKSSEPKGAHNYTKFEIYDTPGHFRSNQNLGKDFASIQREAKAVKFHTFRGAGNSRTMGTGFTFRLKDHAIRDYNQEYLVTEAVHYLQAEIEMPHLEIWRALEPRNIDFPEEIADDYSYTVAAIPVTTQFRAPLDTPWPTMPGLLTAEVVGASGKEIETDEHGRVRVQFRWDREGKKNDKSSCWIRVVTPWSGNNWGINYVPRIGQEVVVQFEDGDPDRPIITGMLYNKEKMPPYVDKAKPTRTGIQTRSSPGGNAKSFNALLFEDDKGQEYLHLQAQKDFQMVVKDSAKMTIGDADKLIDKNEQEADPGSYLQRVKKNVTKEVLEGDKKETIKSGKYDLEVMGDLTEIVKSGNMKVDVNAGELLLKAATKITLQVGGSKIEMTPAMIKVESTMVQVSGSAMLELKGGLVRIN